MRFFTSTRLITLLAALLVAAALPTLASASGKDVIRDCAQDGDLDEEYSDEELDDANRNMPSDIDEYSDCRDVIRRAQAGGKGSADGTGEGNSSGGGTAGGNSGGGASGGGGSGENLTGEDIDGRNGHAADRQALEQRADEARDGSAPDSALETASTSTDSDDSGLPAAALVAIILLVLAGVAGALYVVRDHLPESFTSRLPGFGPGQGR